jgi:HK97 gp10 family phage protein
MPIEELSLEIYGLEDMEKKMDAFGPEFTRECVTKGVLEASELLADVMRSRAPVATDFDTDRDPGTLRDSIGVISDPLKSDKPDFVSATISPEYEKSDGQQSPGYWCRFVEYGSEHNPHPQPFMRPTLDEAGMAAIDLCITVTGAELNAMSGGALDVAEDSKA